MGPASVNTMALTHQLGGNSNKTQVRILVDQENQASFLVHKTLLLEKTPGFRSICNEDFVGNDVETITMLEIDAPTFAIFVEWLNSGTIMTLEYGKGMDYATEKAGILLRLHLLALKYHTVELADRTISGFIAMTRIQNVMPRLKVVYDVYQQAEPSSAIRLVMAKFAALGLRHYSDSGNIRTASYGHYFYSDAQFMMDVLREMRLKPAGEFLDPRRSPLCDFHGHLIQEFCPYERMGPGFAHVV